MADVAPLTYTDAQAATLRAWLHRNLAVGAAYHDHDMAVPPETSRWLQRHLHGRLLELADRARRSR